MVGDRVLVDLGDAPFLRTDGASEVTEVVNRERQVGGERLTHRLAVVPTLGNGQHFEMLLHRICNFVQDTCPLCWCCFSPCIFGGMGGIERDLDILRRRARHLSEGLPRCRAEVRGVLAVERWHPAAVDKVFVARLHRNDTVRAAWFDIGSRLCNGGHACSSLSRWGLSVFDSRTSLPKSEPGNQATSLVFLFTLILK